MMGVIKLNKQNDEKYEQLPKELETFQKNMCDKFGSNAKFHNMYHIQLTDMDGNSEDYFGMNIMTDFYFNERGYANYDEGNKWTRYIYIGDGIDQDHQPSRDNKVMFHVLTTTTYSNESLNSNSPMKYDSVTGYITQAKKIWRTVYDYNISGINTDVQCNEIGFGPAYNNLYSHSKIYDVNGNEKYITKRLNQRLTIEIYWIVTVHKSVYEALWTNGLYGGFEPAKFLWGQYGYRYNRTMVYQWLHRCSGCYTFGYYNSNPRNYDVLAYNNMFSDYYSRGDTITVNGDERTWTTTTRNKENTWTMDLSRWDYFSNIVLASDYVISTISPYSFTMMLYKRYHLSTPETIETIIKTWNYDKTDLYHTIGIDHYVQRASNYDNANSTLRGYLPVTNMNIQSLYRYNFATDAWDVPETYNNPYENEYDYCGFFLQFSVWITWPDNVSRTAYISVNPDYQTKAVTKFNGSGFTCYATDTWWDVSSWESVPNTASVPQTLQNKKFYISSKSNGGSSDGPWVGSESFTYNLWWTYPEFEYQNGIHSIDTAFSPTVDEVTAMGFDSNNGCDSIMYADETVGFYVQNFVVIRKPEENASVIPTQYVLANAVSILQSEFSDMLRCYIGNVFYTEDGKMIHIPVSWYNNYNDYNFNGVRMFIQDLTLPAADISASMQYVNTTSTFTDTQQNIDGGYFLFSLSKYIVIHQWKPSGGTTWDYNSSQFIIVDTDTLQCTLAPFRVGFMRKIYGTTRILCIESPGHCKIFDVATQTIVQEFDVPNEYAIRNGFAFENWIYLNCKLGTTDVLLLYTITDDTIEVIKYPSYLGSTYFNGFSIDSTSSNGSNLDSPTYYSSFASAMSHQLTDYVQYKDGICVLSPRSPGDTDYSVFIISRYNPKNIIVQRCEFYYGIYTIPRLCLSKIYENYYLSISYKCNTSGYNHPYGTSKIIDIGRIVRNDAPMTSSSETYRVDMLPSARDGLTPNEYKMRLFTPYKNKIYEYTNMITGCQVRVLPPEGFISHKINFTTTTCCAWNNPKKVTYPSFNITVTNNV